MTRIAAYAADPATQANNVKRLKGRPAVWRLRVGDYRVLFSGDAECTLVVDIGPRGAIYE